MKESVTLSIELQPAVSHATILLFLFYSKRFGYFSQRNEHKNVYCMLISCEDTNYSVLKLYSLCHFESRLKTLVLKKRLLALDDSVHCAISFNHLKINICI